ncbi:MAG TPA: winged helix-turn-helix transcriptional regulator [Tepidimicrobium sp.]|nr:winged helix-turn-helix transcriptional regulator [Tepidimicrobium sp.]
MDKKEICSGYATDENTLNAIKNSLYGEDVIYDLSQIFKALGDPTRLRILYVLSKRPLCVCDIAYLLDMTQSAISHQLRFLRNLRLVKFKREGRMLIYSLDDEHVLELFNQGLEHVQHR